MSDAIAIREAIRHEFGHVIVAHELDFTILSVQLLGNMKAGAEIEFVETETAEFLKRRIQVLYGGSLAQSLDHGRIELAGAAVLLRHSARDDCKKIVTRLRKLASILYPGASRVSLRATQKQLARSLCEGAAAILESKEELLEALIQLFMQEWACSAERIPFKLGWERFAFLLPARCLET